MSQSPPRWQLVLYSSGSLATALSYQAFATYIQFLYIDVLGLKAAWVGLAWSIYGIWNAVNDPLAGYWSDRTQTRWGRRIPWIAVLFIPLSLTFYLLWLPPEGLVSAGGRSLLIYFLSIVLLFDLLWSIVVMNWTALFPEMVPDEKLRSSVSAWRQVFSLVGLLIGVALPPVLAGEDWSGRGTMALLLGAITAFSFGASLLGSRERPEFRHDDPLPLRQALRATLANRDFLIFLGANLMVQFLFLALTSTVPFYTKYVLRIQQSIEIGRLGLTLDPGTQNSVFLGVAFVVALPAMPIWNRITQRFGAWKSLRVACLTTGATLLTFFWASDFYSGLACVFAFGLSLAGLLMLTDLLIADLVDADELKTGSRREGLYFGMNGLVIRLAFTIQGIITAIMLTSTGYITPSDDILYPLQPDATVSGIRWMLAGIPAGAMGIAFLLLGRYSLRGPRLTEIQREVERLHSQKRAAIE
jgi:GPH family glycoside/pentoside/hexuronide:cation symporter